jgi:hypothetical protein
MLNPTRHSVCWTPEWNPGGVGLEHVVVQGQVADSCLLALDEDGAPFRLAYRLRWDAAHQFQHAELQASKGPHVRSLTLARDAHGAWCDGEGRRLPHLDGCSDIDLWPTPLTNSLPLWRNRMPVGERREFLMAWVNAPELTVEAKPQAYTRLAERQYLFQSLDGTGFEARLALDEHGFVIDYPGLFRRVAVE